MKALTINQTNPAQTGRRVAAGATRPPISAKVANFLERLSLAVAVPAILLFLFQVAATGTASPWVAWPCLAVCVPALLPSVKPSERKGGAL